MRSAAARRFVVLDRDGTLIESHHYLADPEKVRLLPGVVAGLRRFRAMGLGIVVVTNQSAVARGILDLDRLAAIHARMESQLAAEKLRLDGLYVCPHHPEEDCDCRKPRTGLLDQAASEHRFVPRDCFVIGDNTCDIELGRACGASTFLVRTGYGEQVRREGAAEPEHLVDDLVQAAEIIWDTLHSAGERAS